MKMKINKNTHAQAHIEMILSFVIFIGFVFAILVFINPVRDQKINYASVDIAENKILENLSFVYSTVGLILTNAPGSGCFYVNNLVNQAGKLIARDINDELVSAVNDYSVGKIYIQASTTPGIRYYKLYFSDKFANYSIENYANPSVCKELPTANYSFGNLYIGKSILLDNLDSLTNSYMSDYPSLKLNLGLNEDFEYLVYNLNRTKIIADTTSKHKIKTTMVLARDMPLRVFDSNATASDIILNMRVW